MNNYSLMADFWSEVDNRILLSHRSAMLKQYPSVSNLDPQKTIPLWDIQIIIIKVYINNNNAHHFLFSMIVHNCEWRRSYSESRSPTFIRAQVM